MTCFRNTEIMANSVIIREYSYPAAYERAYVILLFKLVVQLEKEAFYRLVAAYRSELEYRNAVIKRDADWLESAIRAIQLAIEPYISVTTRVMRDIGSKTA